MLKDSELAALSALYASWTDDRATPKFVADARQIIARLESAEAALICIRDFSSREMDKHPALAGVLGTCEHYFSQTK